MLEFFFAVVGFLFVIFALVFFPIHSMHISPTVLSSSPLVAYFSFH